MMVVTEYCAGGDLGRALRLDQGTPRRCAPPACTSGFRVCYVNCYLMMIVTEYCAGGDLGRALRLDQGTLRRCALAPRMSWFRMWYVNCYPMMIVTEYCAGGARPLRARQGVGFAAAEHCRTGTAIGGGHSRA